MRPDYDDTEWRHFTRHPKDDRDDWSLMDESPVPWWMALIGGGLVMLVLAVMVALCITGG
jgi:hypothetical protein